MNKEFASGGLLSEYGYFDHIVLGSLLTETFVYHTSDMLVSIRYNLIYPN